MMVRLFHWNAKDLYEFYNLRHEDWPNLPPPPNPRGLQGFLIACVEKTVEQISRENGGDENPARRQHAQGGQYKARPGAGDLPR